MQIILSPPAKGKGFPCVASLMREFFIIECDVYFESRRISSTWNKVWGFWDVTIARGPLIETGHGHGTVEHQRSQWDLYVKRVLDACNKDRADDYGWTWERITERIHVTPELDSTCNDQVSCPTIRLFLYTGKPYGNQ